MTTLGVAKGMQRPCWHAADVNPCHWRKGGASVLEEEDAHCGGLRDSGRVWRGSEQEGERGTRNYTIMERESWDGESSDSAPCVCRHSHSDAVVRIRNFIRSQIAIRDARASAGVYPCTKRNETKPEFRK